LRQSRAAILQTISLGAILQVLNDIAPIRLAELWDNVGLLVGDRQATVRTVMTCLTVTPEVVKEAVQRQVQLIVTHHPIPFKPLSKITSDSTTGRMLLGLIGSGIAVYSAHTAFDSASLGINAMLAEMLGLSRVKPLEPIVGSPDESVGSGRYGYLPEAIPLAAFAFTAAQLVKAPHFRAVDTGVSDSSSRVSKVAIACGSGGSFVGAAKRHGCDTLVTGEATFHACLEAKASDLNLVLVGHYWSERFAMERMATTIESKFDGLIVFASGCDVDPLKDQDSENWKH